MYTEDAETLDIVLSQYESGVVRHRDGRDDGHDSQSRTQPPPSDQHTTESTDGNAHSAVHINDPSLRGRLVLMDESSGEVVGELPERLSFKEDPALISGEKRKQKGEEAGPVVLELPPDMYDAYTSGKGLPVDVIGEDLAETRDVFVRAIPEEEQDWLTTGATVISQVISGSTSLFLSGISTASSYYIKHSAPYVPPPQSPSPVSRPRTPTALTHAHTFTDQAAKASAVTVTYVGKFIRAAVGVEDTPSEPSTPPEPLPPVIVNPSYSVYKPKPRTPTARSKEGSPNLSHSRNTSSGNSPRPQSPEHKPLPTRDRLILSATLVLKTVDDSAVSIPIGHIVPIMEEQIWELNPQMTIIKNVIARLRLEPAHTLHFPFEVEPFTEGSDRCMAGHHSANFCLQRGLNANWDPA
ncbi:hypothetical protein EUX98_g9261 [Antrodiella citrinella]|uniref:Senescence domain-containing protein n=1 Tax=Antrodiella citrinella TaxID=2447956 RepID=A0A4S4M1P7_9APHY|nr:hypothetical protein EUX98_g9261 [Antrodiella citrinella]